MPERKPVLETVRAQTAKPEVGLCGAGVAPGRETGAYSFSGPGAGPADHPARSAAAVALYSAGAAGIETGAGGAVFRPGSPAAAGPALFLLVLSGAAAAPAGEAKIVAGPATLAAWAGYIGTAIDSSLSLAAEALQVFFIVYVGETLILEFPRVVIGWPRIVSRFGDLQGRGVAAFPYREILGNYLSALQVFFLANDSLRGEVGWQEQAPPPRNSSPGVEDTAACHEWPFAKPGADPFLQRNFAQREPLAKGNAVD